MSYSGFLRALIFVRRFLSPYLELVVPFFPKLKERFEFEMRNLTDKSSRPFLSGEADFCFEVSSDGEFEQILPVLNQVLNSNLKVELIYSSPSLEKRVNSLPRNANLRTMRLPILTCDMGNFKVENWITAKNLYLCRYDFFPELILKGRELKNQGGRFGLIWASLKNKDFLFQKGKEFKKWFYRNVFTSFNHFIVPLKEDGKKLEHIGISSNEIEYGEYRVLQVLNRVSNARQIILQKYPNLDSFLNYLEQSQSKTRIIMGSAWEVDLAAFEDFSFQQKLHSGESLCVVVPHDLSSENIETILNKIERNSHIKPMLLSENSSFNGEASAVVVLNLKGILCELYQYFNHAYVGGGFGRSVHSLLEPFLAGCLVYSGPRVHRSTEYDIICEIDKSRIVLLDDPKQLFSSLAQEVGLDTQKIDALSLQGRKSLNNFLQAIK